MGSTPSKRMPLQKAAVGDGEVGLISIATTGSTSASNCDHSYYRNQPTVNSTLIAKIRASTDKICTMVSNGEVKAIAHSMYGNCTLNLLRKNEICELTGIDALYRLLDYILLDTSEATAQSFVSALEAPNIELNDLARYIKQSGNSSLADPQTGRTPMDPAVGPPIGNPSTSQCVLEITNICMERFNCDRLFNLLCQYGTIVRIMFVRPLNGRALVQFSDQRYVTNAIANLNRIVAFGKTMNLRTSKAARIGDIKTPEKLSDGKTSVADYGYDDRSPDWLIENERRRPSKVLFFNNAPTNYTEDEFRALFEAAGCRPPTRVRIFPSTGSKQAMGILEWENLTDATEGLILANNYPITQPGSKPQILKLQYNKPKKATSKKQETTANKSLTQSQPPTAIPQPIHSSDSQNDRNVDIAPRSTYTAGAASTKKNDGTYTPDPVLLQVGDSSSRCTVTVENLDAKLNCDRLFNLFCLYGNIDEISIRQGRFSTAFIRCSDEQSAIRCVQELCNIPAFGRELLVRLCDQGRVPESPTSLFLSDRSPASKSYALDGRNRYKDSENITPRTFDAPSKVLHFYGAPPDVTEVELAELFKRVCAKPFANFTMYNSKGTKNTAAGLLEWSTVGDAVDAVVLANHSDITRTGRVSLYKFKLCFSRRDIWKTTQKK